MFSFMLAVQLLSWGMVIAASLRYTLSTSMEAREIAYVACLPHPFRTETVNKSNEMEGRASFWHQNGQANEVISLSMDNIWRSTQLFYISAPLLLYSIIKGGP